MFLEQSRAEQSRAEQSRAEQSRAECNSYIDFLRGIAALGIIAIHTAFWAGQSYTPGVCEKNSVNKILL